MVDLDVAYSSAIEAGLEIGTLEKGMFARASAVFGDNWRVDPADPPRFTAIQASATYRIPVAGREFMTAFGPVLRVSWADTNADADDDAGFLITPGVQMHLVGNNKLALNLDIFVPESSDLDAEYSIKAQAYIHF